MGSSISRGTLDVIFILFPFVLSAGLIIMIVICWWKCKLIVRRRGHGRKDSNDSTSLNPDEEADYGHLINIQEYAENQVGTTIVYADSPGSSFPHPYVYYSDGRITRIVPLTPSPTATGSSVLKEIPSIGLSLSVCNNKNNNNDQLHLDQPISDSNNTNSIPLQQGPALVDEINNINCNNSISLPNGPSTSNENECSTSTCNSENCPTSDTAV